MSDGERCLRLIHADFSGRDLEPVCLMHSHDPKKPQDEFKAEIEAILAGTSEQHRPNNLFDFSGFVFLEWDFKNVNFTKSANFLGARFTEKADFRYATFTENADFYGAMFKWADFDGARFTKGADFGYATFTERASFQMATFCDAGSFEDMTITGNAIAEFRDARFLKPDMINFHRTNARGTSGLRARFTNCRIEGVQFEAVQWHRHNNRMVLQDELDILEQAPSARSYEEVAIAYRRLITNFEKARAYDLTEDCTIGEFEMKRRNPDRLPFAALLKLDYECLPSLRAIGEWVSIVGIYRLSSLYGTSYQRAMGVLALLLVVFGLCFSIIVDICPKPTSNGIATCRHSNVFDELGSGLLHATEVATLQRTPLSEPVSAAGRIVEIVEQILVAGQATLLLFALSRRFRR
jgi:uncharacterized protein YjbI with pentapeptide repeats